MSVLIKKCTIVDKNSSHHKTVKDVFIEKGIIKKIAKDLDVKAKRIIQEKDTYLSIGFADLGTQVCDPGFEYREDLESVSQAALAGGYTAIACFPNSSPAVHNKSQVQYILNKTQNNKVDFFPIGAITLETQGKDLSEIYDMHHAGAIAFSDGKNGISDNGMMIRALQYVLPFNGLVINNPLDKSSSHNGQMHEGLTSTQMGTSGIPSVAEELMVSRDLQVLEYTQSRLHIHNISTANSVELIKKAKKKGLEVTCSVAALNLIFEDKDLSDFNSNLKVMPPLRENSDVKALIKGLKDGTIDCITTNHTPWDIEHKDLEFAYAEFGAIGLQTTFSALIHYLSKDLSIELIIDKIAQSPREILKVKTPILEENQVANCVLFNINQSFTFSKDMIVSKSHNSPFINKELKGEIISVF